MNLLNKSPLSKWDIKKLGDIQKRYREVRVEIFKTGYFTIVEDGNTKKMAGTKEAIINNRVFPIYPIDSTDKGYRQRMIAQHLPEITSINPEILLTIFCTSFPPVKSTKTNKYCAVETIAKINDIADSEKLNAIANILYYTPILKFKKVENKNVHNMFIPPILNKYREMYDIKYTDWDIESIQKVPGFLGAYLLEILPYNNDLSEIYNSGTFQHIRAIYPKTETDIQNFRGTYINTEIWNNKGYEKQVLFKNKGSMISTYNLNHKLFTYLQDSLSPIPYIMSQTWYCNVKTRRPEAMILDLTDWNNVPEPVDEQFPGPEKHREFPFV